MGPSPYLLGSAILIAMAIVRLDFVVEPVQIIAVLVLLASALFSALVPRLWYLWLALFGGSIPLVGFLLAALNARHFMAQQNVGVFSAMVPALLGCLLGFGFSCGAVQCARLLRDSPDRP